MGPTVPHALESKNFHFFFFLLKPVFFFSEIAEKVGFPQFLKCGSRLIVIMLAHGQKFFIA